MSFIEVARISLVVFSLALLSWKNKRNNRFPARKFVLRSTFFQVTLIGNLHTCIFKETFEGQNNYLLFGVRGESGKPNSIIFILFWLFQRPDRVCKEKKCLWSNVGISLPSLALITILQHFPRTKTRTLSHNYL